MRVFINKKGKATGISFIDSTPIQVCKPKRASLNKARLIQNGAEIRFELRQLASRIYIYSTARVLAQSQISTPFCISLVFKGIAKKGKSTIGWVYGFKLHLIINDLGELI